MGILDFLKPKAIQVKKNLVSMKELGKYNATFTAFGGDVYSNDVVRSCIRPLAEHSSKARARCNNKQLENILNNNPNIYMNGKDFIAKVRNKLEIQNTAFILISRDDRGHAVEFYPIPWQSLEVLRDEKMHIYIRFSFANGNKMVAAWEDLAVIRKDYNQSDIAGDDNRALYQLLDLISTTNQGIANAVKATANLRGILKNTKGMISREDVKKQQEEFVKDYLGLENGSGIASLDSTQEFIPITMNPAVTSFAQMKEFRENIFRYFGVSDAIVQSNYNESQMEAFYDSKIEPFLIALSLELTRKCFTQREQTFGSAIVYESNRLQYSNMATKLSMVSLVDRGALTPNEWRAMFYLTPIDGGDEPIRRLDTAVVNEHNQQAELEAGEDAQEGSQEEEDND